MELPYKIEIMEKWTVENIPDLSGKVIIVTGGNSGLGYESVKAFAGKGAEVVLASRDVQKGEASKAEIIKTHPDGRINVIELDLMELNSIKTFAKNFAEKYDSLNVLLNNAGVMTTPYFKTKDGFEGQMGTNHLGHFALTGLLVNLLSQTKGSRVVNVSSGAHRFGKMDFDNLLFDGEKDYSPMKAYGRSKLSNLLFTYELQRRFEENKIDSISVASHPGGSRTNLDRHVNGKFWFKLLWPLFRLTTQSQAQGALPQIRASVDKGVRASQYYGPHRNMTGYPIVVESNKASHNMADAKKLWEMSEDYTGTVYAY